MANMVHCSYFGREAKALDSPPFPGPLGQEIQARVSEDAWLLWIEMEIKIINEYKLDLAEADHKKKLLAQMRAFLKLDDAESADKPAKKILHVGTPRL